MRAYRAAPNLVTWFDMTFLGWGCRWLHHIEDDTAKLESECERRNEETRLVVLVDTVGIEEVDVVDCGVCNFDVNQRFCRWWTRFCLQ